MTPDWISWHTMKQRDNSIAAALILLVCVAWFLQTQHMFSSRKTSYAYCLAIPIWYVDSFGFYKEKHGYIFVVYNSQLRVALLSFVVISGISENSDSKDSATVVPISTVCQVLCKLMSFNCLNVDKRFTEKSKIESESEANRQRSIELNCSEARA